MKLLTIILLLTLQSGRYNIDTCGSKKAEGTITLNPFWIRIAEKDTTILPVTRVVKDGNKTFYFLEGTANNLHYRGAATLYRSGSIKKIGSSIQTVYLLKIELRSKQSYIELRYVIYHES